LVGAAALWPNPEHSDNATAAIGQIQVLFFYFHNAKVLTVIRLDRVDRGVFKSFE